MASWDSVAQAEITPLQDWHPNLDVCKIETMGGRVFRLSVIPQGKPLKCHLNDEVYNDEQNPGPDDGATGDVLVLCRRRSG